MVAAIRNILQYIPVGERLAELYYATWMVVVSIGLLGAMEASITSIVAVTIVAFAVNIIWGLIDGITVMYGLIITRRYHNILIKKMKQGDISAREAARRTLDDTIVSALDEDEIENVLDAIASIKEIPEYSSRPLKSEISYMIGIVFLNLIIVIPLIIPLYLVPDYHVAVYTSNIISVAIFAMLGAAYAKKLNKNVWVAALVFATIGIILATIVFEYGW